MDLTNKVDLRGGVPQRNETSEPYNERRNIDQSDCKSMVDDEVLMLQTTEKLSGVEYDEKILSRLFTFALY